MKLMKWSSPTDVWTEEDAWIWMVHVRFGPCCCASTSLLWPGLWQIPRARPKQQTRPGGLTTQCNMLKSISDPLQWLKKSSNCSNTCFDIVSDRSHPGYSMQYLMCLLPLLKSNSWVNSKHLLPSSCSNNLKTLPVSIMVLRQNDLQSSGSSWLVTKLHMRLQRWKINIRDSWDNGSSSSLHHFQFSATKLLLEWIYSRDWQEAFYLRSFCLNQSIWRWSVWKTSVFLRFSSLCSWGYLQLGFFRLLTFILVAARANAEGYENAVSWPLGNGKNHTFGSRSPCTSSNDCVTKDDKRLLVNMTVSYHINSYYIIIFHDHPIIQSSDHPISSPKSTHMKPPLKDSFQFTKRQLTGG